MELCSEKSIDTDIDTMIYEHLFSIFHLSITFLLQQQRHVLFWACFDNCTFSLHFSTSSEYISSNVHTLIQLFIFALCNMFCTRNVYKYYIPCWFNIYYFDIICIWATILPFVLIELVTFCIIVYFTKMILFC